MIKSPRRTTLMAMTASLALAGAVRAEETGACRTLLVVEKGEGAVVAIDVASGARLWRAPAGVDPHEIVVAADGSRAFVSNYGGPGGALHSLSVIGLPKGSPLPPVDLWPLRSPHGLAARDGSIWFTAESSKAVGRYDVASGRVAWALGLGQDRTHMIALGQAGTIIAANANSGSVSIVEPSEVTFGSAPPRKDWKVTQVAVGEGAQGIDISADGGTIWVMAAKRGVVSVIDVASKTVVGQVELPWKSGNRLKLTPDGSLALVASEQLVAIDTQTRRFRTLALGKTRAEGIVIAPDGRRAFVALPAENQVAVVTLPDLKIDAYIVTGRTPDGLACAPASER